MADAVVIEPVSAAKFPANREKNREFSNFEPSCCCPYRKSSPYVLMVQPTEDGPRFDVPGALNDPSNRRILA